MGPQTTNLDAVITLLEFGALALLAFALVHGIPWCIRQWPRLQAEIADLWTNRQQLAQVIREAFSVGRSNAAQRTRERSERHDLLAEQRRRFEARRREAKG